MESVSEFLRARIAEDEAEIGPLDGRDETAGPNGVGWAEVGAISEVLMTSHARVLRECEAKRRIVEAFADAEVAVAGYDNDDPNNPPSYWQEWGNRHALALAVASLAAIYSDHPGFRDEWRP